MMLSAIDTEVLTEEFGIYFMKSTSKIIFGCLATSLSIAISSPQGYAQTAPSTAPKKPLSPAALKALCKQKPQDSLCTKKTTSPSSTSPGGADSLTTTPASSSSTPASSGLSAPGDGGATSPSGGTPLPAPSTGGETGPAGTPSAPASGTSAPGDSMAPTGGSGPGGSMSAPTGGAAPGSLPSTPK
jgi:hypothetical protein